MIKINLAAYTGSTHIIGESFFQVCLKAVLTCRYCMYILWFTVMNPSSFWLWRNHFEQHFSFTSGKRIFASLEANRLNNNVDRFKSSFCFIVKVPPCLQSLTLNRWEVIASQRLWIGGIVSAADSLLFKDRGTNVWNRFLSWFVFMKRCFEVHTRSLWCFHL